MTEPVVVAQGTRSIGSAPRAMVSAAALAFVLGCRPATPPSAEAPPPVLVEAEAPAPVQQRTALPEAVDVPVEAIPGHTWAPAEARPVEPPPVAEPPRRSRRRMDIDQLEASIAQAFGGERWVESATATKTLFESLSSTLGKPDWRDSTAEDLAPSALFHKFLTDAASQVCTRVARREADPAVSPRWLLVQAAPSDTFRSRPASIHANVEALVLRLHGHRSTGIDDPVVAQWRWVFEQAEHLGQPPVEAWRAVCVALLTDAAFYTY